MPNFFPLQQKDARRKLRHLSDEQEFPGKYLLMPHGEFRPKLGRNRASCPALSPPVETLKGSSQALKARPALNESRGLGTERQGHLRLERLGHLRGQADLLSPRSDMLTGRVARSYWPKVYATAVVRSSACCGSTALDL